METKTATQTETIIAEMMTENTGRSILDSGGQNGRGWQQAQKAVGEKSAVDYYKETPEVTMEVSGNDTDGYTLDYFTISTFHWLVQSADYCPTMQRRFDLWLAISQGESFGTGTLSEMQEFAELVADGSHYEKPMVVNTYNHENDLSDIVQYVQFRYDDMDYALIQIHRGADARGGYTYAKAFQVNESFGCNTHANIVVNNENATDWIAEQSNNDCWSFNDYKMPEEHLELVKRSEAIADGLTDWRNPYKFASINKENATLHSVCGLTVTGYMPYLGG